MLFMNVLGLSLNLTIPTRNSAFQFMLQLVQNIVGGV